MKAAFWLIGPRGIPQSHANASSEAYISQITAPINLSRNFLTRKNKYAASETERIGLLELNSRIRPRMLRASAVRVRGGNGYVGLSPLELANTVKLTE